MAEQFTNIDLEVYINGAWLSIWGDVLTDPEPHVTRGIVGNRPDDRIANIGELEFSLNNSQANSARLIGYYSPEHDNCLAGWGPGLRVRLSFSYDAWTVRKWIGRINPDGIHVISGTLGPRRVEVKCSDYMYVAMNHKMDLIEAQTNLTANQAVAYLMTNIPLQPDAVEYLSTDTAVMPYVFDGGTIQTTALGELNKIATSTRSYIYVKSDNRGEYLQIASSDRTDTVPVPSANAENWQTEAGDNIQTEAGTPWLVDQQGAASFSDADFQEGTDISYGRYITNQVTITNYPRRFDGTPIVLWSLQKATRLDAGESVTFRAAYRDPAGGNTEIKGKDFVIPVSGTDYEAFANEDGTGTNYTASMGVTVDFGVVDAEVTVTNNHATDSFYFGGDDITFQLRGAGIYLYDPVRVIAEDATSILTHGLKEAFLDFRYQDAPTDKVDIATLRVTQFKDPHYNADALVIIPNRSPREMAGFMFCEPGYGVTVSDTMTSYSASGRRIQSYEFEIIGKSYVRWTFGVQAAA